MPQYHQRRTGKTLSLNQVGFKPIFLLLLVSVLINSCNNNQELIEENVSETRKTLPLSLDDNTTWIDVQAGENAFIYIYKLSGKTDDSFISSKDQIKSQIILTLKQNNQKGVKDLLKRGIHFDYIWQNNQGKELFRFTISADDLNMN